MTGTGVAPSGSFELGDRVIAAADLGGFWWPKIRAGTRGIVIGFGPRGALVVHFAGRHTLRVELGCVIGWEPLEYAVR